MKRRIILFLQHSVLIIFVLATFILLSCCTEPAGNAAPAGASIFPILYTQLDASTGANGRIQGRTLAVFPSFAAHRVAVFPSMGSIFWSGDHRQVLALGGRPFSATVRVYDAAQSRFGSPVDAANALADPGIHYALPLHDLAQTNASDWSRDGRTLCFAQNKLGLILIDLRRGTRQILHNPFFERHPVSALALSPDGSQVAFSIEGRDEFHTQFFQDLWVIRRDGRSLHKLGHGNFPNWSPSGRFLLATEGPADDGGRAILRYDTQTGARRVLNFIPQPAEGDGYFAQARYSSSGEQIAVFGPPNPKVPDATALFLMSGEGKFLRVLATQQQLNEAGIPESLSW